MKTLKKRGIIALCFAIFTSLVTAFQHQKITFEHFLSEIESLADDEIIENDGSCTVTYICVDAVGNSNGSISCTGKKCLREEEKEGIVFVTTKRYVECDGKRTYC